MTEEKLGKFLDSIKDAIGTENARLRDMSEIDQEGENWLIFKKGYSRGKFDTLVEIKNELENLLYIKENKK